jgi:type VI secretion system protein ImpC
MPETEHLRTRITYTWTFYEERTMELPFVVGLLADLSGRPERPLPPLESRKFVRVTSENFENVMEWARPRLEIEIPDLLHPGDGQLHMVLEFHTLADFEPPAVVNQIPVLRHHLDHPALPRQVGAILRDPGLRKLEATWRGLDFVIQRTPASPLIQTAVFNVGEQELGQDFAARSDFQGSALAAKLGDEFRITGGWPFAVLLGDYYFGAERGQMRLLQSLALLGEALHAPFIGAARDDVTLPDFFRAASHSRYAGLVTPRFLARSPHPEEAGGGEPLWSNPVYLLAAQMINAFHRHGWCATFTGAESGGLVDGLATRSAAGPLERAIGEREDTDLVGRGVMPILHWKGTDRAVFMAAPTCHSPEPANPAASRLPYVLAGCRFVHNLRTMIRDNRQKPRSAEECEQFLNAWLGRYVLDREDTSEEERARRPLRQAHVQIRGGSPRFRATLRLRPHFQMPDPVEPLQFSFEL